MNMMHSSCKLALMTPSKQKGSKWPDRLQFCQNPPTNDQLQVLSSKAAKSKIEIHGNGVLELSKATMEVFRQLLLPHSSKNLKALTAPVWGFWFPETSCGAKLLEAGTAKRAPWHLSQRTALLCQREKSWAHSNFQTLQPSKAEIPCVAQK